MIRIFSKKIWKVCEWGRWMQSVNEVGECSLWMRQVNAVCEWGRWMHSVNEAGECILWMRQVNAVCEWSRWMHFFITVSQICETELDICLTDIWHGAAGKKSAQISVSYDSLANLTDIFHKHTVLFLTVYKQHNSSKTVGKKRIVRSLWQYQAWSKG